MNVINLRTMQVVIVAAMASWGIMDGIGNLIVYDTWVKIVAFVLTLEETMVNGAPHPRAIYTLCYLTLVMPLSIYQNSLVACYA